MKLRYCISSLLMATAPLAQAEIFFQDSFNITASGPGSVGYLPFSLSQPQEVDIFTDGPTTDPQIHLFKGSLTPENLIASDDDSCPDGRCGAAGSYNNALLDNQQLDAGDYILAISDFPFDSQEAIDGSNDNDRTGTITAKVADPLTVQGFGSSGVTAAQIAAGQIRAEQAKSEQIVRQTYTVMSQHIASQIASSFGFGPRMRAREDEAANGNRMAASGDTGGVMPDVFWGKTIYSSLNEDGGNLAYDTDIYQFIGGVDKKIGNFYLGSALTYAYSETDQFGNNNSSHTIGITPYVAYKITDYLFASAMGGYNYTGVNGTAGKNDADVHDYIGEFDINAFKVINDFFVKGRAGVRYKHNYTSIFNNTLDADYDELTWIGDVEFGYSVNDNLRVHTGALYEYYDKEDSGSSVIASVNSNAVHDGVVFIRAGLDYSLSDSLSVGADASTEVTDNNNDLYTVGVNMRLEL